MPEGFILEPLFLIYVNNMPQALKSNLFLYVDDSCLMSHGIEKQLNKNFENVCNWFVDNKLSIHTVEDKTKSILFISIKSKVQEN